MGWAQHRPWRRPRKRSAGRGHCPPGAASRVLRESRGPKSSSELHLFRKQRRPRSEVDAMATASLPTHLFQPTSRGGPATITNPRLTEDLILGLGINRSAVKGGRNPLSSQRRGRRAPGSQQDASHGRGHGGGGCGCRPSRLLPADSIAPGRGSRETPLSTSLGQVSPLASLLTTSGGPDGGGPGPGTALPLKRHGCARPTTMPCLCGGPGLVIMLRRDKRTKGQRKGLEETQALASRRG